ncbi:MAG TPA: sugar phosphate isomerase/epimerase [Gemmatimonadaceae bacterium]|jgi:sugar phosphate isomerase/epimerase
MKRRDFVQTLGTAFAAAPLLPRIAAPSDNLWRIGLELYSVRNAMKKDPEGTLAAVRTAGYDDVELLWSFDNFGRTPKQVHDTLKQLGLKAPSGHIAPEVLQNGWEKLLDDAKTVGHQFVVVPSLPDDTAHSLDEWKRWADRFNSAGDLARRKGLWLMFHNEPDHMKPIDGIVPYDLFIERTDPSRVRLQLDFGNMEVGGGSPMQYIRQHRDRYWSFHVKDVVQDGTHDTELGTGRMNLRALLAAIPEVQKKPCYVEQESPSDEMSSARRNYGYLKGLQF